jgi:hypothetical protein
MPFLHNDKFRNFWPENTISWAGVWLPAGYVVVVICREGTRFFHAETQSAQSEMEKDLR